MSAASPFLERHYWQAGFGQSGQDYHARRHTTETGIPIGRRSAPRLRLSIPARIVSLYATHRCILIDVSATGAQVGLEKPLRIGDTAMLEVAGREIFCEVVRTAKGENGGANGLVFDPPLEDQDVLDIRAYAESYEAAEMRGLRAEVRRWVEGSIDHT